MAHIQASLQGERAEYLAQAQKKKQKKENAITNAVKRAIKNSLSLKRPKKGYIIGPCITWTLITFIFILLSDTSVKSAWKLKTVS